MEVNADWRTFAVRDKLMDRLKLACKTRETDQRKLNCLHPLIPFNNPAVAVQIGLFDSLKHLVEVNGIDVNSFEWTAFSFTKRMHLLYYAGYFGQEKIFEYLLNRPDFNLRCKASEAVRSQSLFLNLIDQDCVSMESGRFEHPFLKMFMQHQEFDINGLIIPFKPYGIAVAVPLVFSQSQSLVTPLLCATFHCVYVLTTDQFNEEKFRRILQAMEVLLSADADPNLSFPHCMSPITYLRFSWRRAKADAHSIEAYRPTERYWDEALTLLKKYA